MAIKRDTKKAAVIKSKTTSKKAAKIASKKKAVKKEPKIQKGASKDEDRKKGEPFKNIKWEQFCFLYTSPSEFFGNGVQAYIEAYNIDLTKQGAYASAKQMASKLLTNVYLLARINELLEDGGLNDANVEKQLLFCINQSADMATKRGSIDMYFKWKGKFEKHNEQSRPQVILSELLGSIDGSTKDLV